MRSALGLLGQLVRYRNTRLLVSSSIVHPPAASYTANAALVATSHASSGAPGGVPSICRDLRKLLLNRPYAAAGGKGRGKGKITADPEDEKMLSEGGGCKESYGKECSRVKQTKPRSTIEKVLPGKRTTQQEMKRHARVSVKKVKVAAKKVTDKAKKGIDKAKKKAGDTVKKVKDTGKKIGKEAKKAAGGGGGGGKKKGGKGGKKGGGGGGKKGDGGGKKGGGGGKKGGGKKKK